jgi:hypothetical protein
VCRELAQELYSHDIMPSDRQSRGGGAGAGPQLKDPEGLRPGVPSYRVDVGIALVWVELAPSTPPVGPRVLPGIEVRHPVHTAIFSLHPMMG